MLREIISTLAGLAAAFVLGYAARAGQERRRTPRPKTLKQLTREQRIKPIRAPGGLPAFDPVLFTVEDLARWDAAMREAREP
ncbi:MAG TPA: hypothetical protein VFU74_21750 [Actinocrinis sp.]|nr:hypothetical protein [Actinocrinis sp.]